jgi:hypothetical protein
MAKFQVLLKPRLDESRAEGKFVRKAGRTGEAKRRTQVRLSA